MQIHDDRDAIQASPEDLPAIDTGACECSVTRADSRRGCAQLILRFLTVHAHACSFARMSSALCNVDTQRLELRSAEATPPAPGEVQIDVVSSGIGGTDPHIFHGARDHRVRIPQIPGHEMSGVVAAAGAGVAHVKAGDHVVVYPQPVPLNRCDFFWQELQLIGARVYERQDYHRAIELLACGALPLEKRITDIVPLEGGPRAFETLRGNPSAMKVLIDCR